MPEIRNATLGYIINAVQLTLALAAFNPWLELSAGFQAAIVACIAGWGIVWLAINDSRRGNPPKGATKG